MHYAHLATESTRAADAQTVITAVALHNRVCRSKLPRGEGRLLLRAPHRRKLTPLGHQVLGTRTSIAMQTRFLSLPPPYHHFNHVLQLRILSLATIYTYLLSLSLSLSLSVALCLSMPLSVTLCLYLSLSFYVTLCHSLSLSTQERVHPLLLHRRRLYAEPSLRVVRLCAKAL